MDKIKVIAGEIMEEIDGARNYYKWQRGWSSTSATISKIYGEMAEQELMHAKHLMDVLKEIHKMADVGEAERAVIEFVLEVSQDQIDKVGRG